MANCKKLRLKGAALKRLLSVVLVTLLGVSLLVVSLRTNTTPGLTGLDEDLSETIDIQSFSDRLNNLTKLNEFSIRLDKQNQFPPRNKDLYPKLAKDHINIVLYVHNRPQYLRVVVESLSKVVGINETLLIVSHDGYFEEMNKIVEGIKFCQVKQIFAPYSPHVFTDGFPGVSWDDCKEKMCWES
ncbi:N-acetylglucosaminyltransferase II [Hibiscus trionum]|uniref:Alpha-1,6-mannosyl-glycoprotein 2-beta-N-acetylglucosaminyltransferase n=1 Tax=Hibiscus trionum TaxID=183268 RepID=A0A9W7H6C5_HIBTR|nr:N-acetylglucosaminyltransferase II [Hibiscus trionum]